MCISLLVGDIFLTDRHLFLAIDHPDLSTFKQKRYHQYHDTYYTRKSVEYSDIYQTVQSYVWALQMCFRRFVRNPGHELCTSESSSRHQRIRAIMAMHAC